jgi:hypothetical protein
MNFLFLVAVVFIFLFISGLLMAVGVIVKNKTFKSCGCAAAEFNGEKIDCPGGCGRTP